MTRKTIRPIATIALAALAASLLPAAASLLPAAASSNKPSVQLQLHSDYGVLLAGQENRPVLKIGLFPEMPAHRSRREPINLAIVLDRSGSMSGSAIETAKQAAIQAIGMLQPDDRVSLVAYNQSVQVVIPLSPMHRIHDPLTAISRIQAGGNTAIYAGVNEAAAQLRCHESDGAFAFNRILLLSDGLANVGPSRPHDFAALGRALNREGISVSTIGLGSNFNEDLMTSLSHAGQGNTYYAESYRDLHGIFESELGDVTSIAAQDIEVEIECQPGFRPIRFLGREGRIEGRRATFQIKHLYGGQEKFALLELEADATHAPKTVPMATVKAVYQDMASKKQNQLADAFEATFTADTEIRERSVNIDVQRDVVANRVAMAKDEAIALADQGQPTAAAKTMKDLNSWIQSANQSWDDDQVAQESQALADQAREIEEEGLTNAARKELRSSAYSTRQQQKNYKDN